MDYNVMILLQEMEDVLFVIKVILAQTVFPVSKEVVKMDNVLMESVVMVLVLFVIQGTLVLTVLLVKFHVLMVFLALMAKAVMVVVSSVSHVFMEKLVNPVHVSAVFVMIQLMVMVYVYQETAQKVLLGHSAFPVVLMVNVLVLRTPMVPVYIVILTTLV